MERIAYEEFGYLHENAEEFGLPHDGPPVVRREPVPLADGRRLSALVWGTAPPELVFLHGGAQNAHTWDTVALALGRPMVALDLPGHGHADAGRRGSLDLEANAADVAEAVAALAPTASTVVGMSLGGLTAIALTAAAPELVRSLALIDITPTPSAAGSAAIRAFVDGPESFAGFDEILARTVAHNPTRSEASLRRGILHNALQRDDGTWVWRHARFRADEQAVDPAPPDLWEAVSAIAAPLLLVRGLRPQSVVTDENEAELRRRVPHAEVAHVAEAGHSVQGDQPVALAALLDDFVDRVAAG